MTPMPSVFAMRTIASRILRAPAVPQLPQHVTHHPAVELGHQTQLLEERQELPRRQQRLFLVAQANQHLGHRVAAAAKRANRLAEERELVRRERVLEALAS